MKKKVNNSTTDANNTEVPKQKERHIVSWSQEEDDILREQIRVHGTENWAIIASKFKDKTTRQCRRRWFTYLNSDFKKGGWSPEEDMLLCEAQKIFGNRWTEIAKVVSGRTDNAVKNRFTTLCKKRAKREAVAKENNPTSYVNLNNKRVIFPNEPETVVPFKKMRTFNSNAREEHHLLRPPFAVLAQNVGSCEINFSAQVNNVSINEQNNKVGGSFLKKDDPKVVALMQQAELLSSLAVKVNSEKTDQNLESAWTALEDFLKQNKESDPLESDFQLDKFKELMEDLRSDNEGSRHSWREPDLYESSPSSSEYSAGSTLLPDLPCEECPSELQSDQLHDQQHCHAEESRNEVDNMLTCNEYSYTEFGSPIHVTPLFGPLAATIPSPKFSESEKHFLMKTLGLDTTSPTANTKPSQPPPCKRSLLHCLSPV